MTQAICTACSEPIRYAERWNEWHTTARRPAEHYVNVCQGSANGHRPVCERARQREGAS